MWRSLVAHLTGGQGVAGSNPVIPTNFKHFETLQLVAQHCSRLVTDTSCDHGPYPVTNHPAARRPPRHRLRSSREVITCPSEALGPRCSCAATSPTHCRRVAPGGGLLQAPKTIEFAQLCLLGVDGIFMDYPDIAVRVYRRERVPRRSRGQGSIDQLGESDAVRAIPGFVDLQRECRSIWALGGGRQ
jgi:hypothetical protein